ncbi:MAG: hypothetical protein EBU29_12755 [Gammaproteobacteria bacterium]|nr:hypothetical protein [Gammaproteobacteria bacterium]
MSPADLLPLHLGSKAQGTVRVPGSKSLSNRLLLLAAAPSRRWGSKRRVEKRGSGYAAPAGA